MVKNWMIRSMKAGFLAVFMVLLSGCQGVALLDPKGPVGQGTMNLMVITVVLGLIVIIPVIVMTIWFAIRYRETNTKATYKPHWEGSLKIEAVIWLVPVAIIVVLSYFTWISTIELDPYKPLPSKEQPLRVQVVSTDWNWLFIYPDYEAASLNKLVIPTGVPVIFDMTSASVMTSFFIPDLGSQMYVMAGMVSHLNLMSSHDGTYTGRNMEYSGEGYNSMNFPTKSVSAEQFQAWLQEAKASPKALSVAEFDLLSKPQKDLPDTAFSKVEPKLFDQIVARFMKDHGSGNSNSAEAPTEPMTMSH